MIKHFYLLYYNFIKWQEGTKWFNNNRKTEFAESFITLIVLLWVLFIYFGIVKLFNLDLGLIENLGKYKFVLIVTTPILLIRFIILKIFKTTFLNFEFEYNQIGDWKNSNYRRRAQIYSLFYLFFFIPLMLYCFI